MEEKRRFPRLDIRVKVKWEKFTEKADIVGEEIAISGNISEGGISFVIDKKTVAIGDILFIIFELPTGESVLANVNVVWIDEYKGEDQSHKGKLALGVEFLVISKEDRKAIKQFVSASIQ